MQAELQHLEISGSSKSLGKWPTKASELVFEFSGLLSVDSFTYICYKHNKLFYSRAHNLNKMKTTDDTMKPSAQLTMHTHPSAEVFNPLNFALSHEEEEEDTRFYAAETVC